MLKNESISRKRQREHSPPSPLTCNVGPLLADKCCASACPAFCWPAAVRRTPPRWDRHLNHEAAHHTGSTQRPHLDCASLCLFVVPENGQANQKKNSLILKSSFQFSYHCLSQRSQFENEHFKNEKNQFLSILVKYKTLLNFKGKLALI